MKRLISTLALVVVTSLLGATMAMAANSGTLNVTRDGNYTTGGTYNFKARKHSNGAWEIRLKGNFKVTEPTARVEVRPDFFGWYLGVRRTTNGTSAYDKYVRSDVTVADSTSLRVCYEGLLWWDCTEKTVWR